MVPARPGLSGRVCWVRSRAWIWDFSSMHSTTAWSGGFRYRPTTSMSFSSNRLSLEILNVLTRCGWMPRADQIRCTVAGLTACALAMLRHDQWVSPGGFSCKVARTIASTFSALTDGLRPRPGRTRPSFARPSVANPSRHAATLAGDTPSRAAIAVFASPSPASSSAFPGAAAGALVACPGGSKVVEGGRSAGRPLAESGAPDPRPYAPAQPRRYARCAALAGARNKTRRACHILAEVGDDALAAV